MNRRGIKKLFLIYFNFIATMGQLIIEKMIMKNKRNDYEKIIENDYEKIIENGK